MVSPALVRQRLSRTLSAAYAEGVLSPQTLAHRLELLFAGPLVDPARIVGDLPPRRRSSRRRERATERLRASWRTLTQGHRSSEDETVLLALDWDGGADELLVGRHSSCDVVLDDPTVSRRHARLRRRDGVWVLQDLDSTNGTLLNGHRVGRCRLRPGDRLVLGEHHLLVD